MIPTKHIVLLILSALSCIVFLTGSVRAQQTPLEIGQALPEFELKDSAGTPFRSTDVKGKRVTAVIFMGVECPLVKLYSSRLEKMKKRLRGNVQLVGIDSNRQDSLTEIKQFVKQHQVTFPVLKDTGNTVADQFGAQRTPQVFVFDLDGKLCYRGAIDDQYTYGQQKREVESNFLMEALEAAVAGKQPKVAMTQSDGCIIGRVLEPTEESNVTYTNQISRILNKHCVSCHREGEVAPFSLTDYDEVVGWAEMIAEVTQERRMPPWHANPAHGKFANDISLAPEQIELIAQWVKQGAPKGDEQDMPEPPKFETGWRIGKPDVVFEMSDEPFEVPATGVIPYKYFVVDTNFKEDKWIQAAECRIGNRAVVHHIIVMLDKRRGGRAHGQVDSEWITATAPGSPPLQLEEGFAKLIPAGAKLVFQMHYTPCGTRQSDLSKVGFKFADPNKVKKSVGTVEVVERGFTIPARHNNFRVPASRTFNDNILILSMFPHMHVRGKSFKYTARYPDGKAEILLDVPRYDFNWQNGYQFPKPKFIPAGTVIECVAHYDNSAENFANPDPSEAVRWGDQTDDEMMIGYFDMALADQDLTQTTGKSPRTQVVVNRIEAGGDLMKGLKSLATQAVNSKEKMDEFGESLAERFSNLDRVCVTVEEGDEINVARVVQRGDFRRSAGQEGIRFRAKNSLIKEVMETGQPTVVKLAAARGPDAKKMSQVFASSLHIPIKVGGKTATVNFWSTEAAAFPKPIKTALVDLVQSALGEAE